MVDVGQGIVSFAGHAGRTVLIDVGGRVDFGRSEVLWSGLGKQMRSEPDFICIVGRE